VAIENYSGQYVTGVEASDVIKMPGIAPHGAAVFKVCRMGTKPVVVKFTGHYSMGGEFDVLEMVDGELHYEVSNRFDCSIEYTVLLPDGRIMEVIS
jgi:hypothetical protein